MYIYLNIYAMITIVIKNTTPAPTAPKTVSMFWPVFSDFDSTKSKLLYTGENKKSVKVKKKALNSCFPRLIVMIIIWNNWTIMLHKSNVVSSVFVARQFRGFLQIVEWINGYCRQQCYSAMFPYNSHEALKESWKRFL